MIANTCSKCRDEEAIARVRRERDAYKWGYEYLQSRMDSLHRYGWAHDCDGEIQARIGGAQ